MAKMLGAAVQDLGEPLAEPNLGVHTLSEPVARWARRKPNTVALVNADTERQVTWQQLDDASSALALKLLQMGFRKGDSLALFLSFMTEHVFLTYACFKIGVIVVPLDLRVKAPEIATWVNMVQPKGFVYLGQTSSGDFRHVAETVMAGCPSIRHFIEVSLPHVDPLPGAVSYQSVAQEGKELLAAVRSGLRHTRSQLAQFEKAASEVSGDDAAVVIFTTGTTGYPKPALLAHKGIACACDGLAGFLGLGENLKMLIDLPPAHIAGLGCQLMTTLSSGGQAVLMHSFNPERALQAVQEHRVNVLLQIPSQYNLQWRLPNFHDYDLSSLVYGVIGGQGAPAAVVNRLGEMVPQVLTGLGVTEVSGMCTYARVAIPFDPAAGVGFATSAYPLTIREPMRGDGMAGPELPRGTVGAVCFQGLQTFLGYIGNPEASRRAISKDGVLYTGDMGFVDERGLHLVGRARFVIKPKGHQVFPGQVEDYIGMLQDKVAAVAVVGAEHAVYSEAILAFVEKRPGAELTVDELEEFARGMPAYRRPLHYLLLEPGQMPCNRSGKPDYPCLEERAHAEVARLRAEGGWDA